MSEELTAEPTPEATPEDQVEWRDPAGRMTGRAAGQDPDAGGDSEPAEPGETREQPEAAEQDETLEETADAENGETPEQPEAAAAVEEALDLPETPAAEPIELPESPTVDETELPEAQEEIETGELVADLRRRRRRVRTLDFSQPTKFTAELRRRIARVLVPFCETMASRLSSDLRAPVEVTLLDSTQLSWAAARAQLPADALALGLDVVPVERQMMLSIERPLILRMLECLLGGEAGNASASRRLSEIDWALTRQLLEPMIGQLSLAWRDLGGIELRLREIDPEGDAGVLAPIGEPTYAVRLVCSIDGLPASMSLLIPWTAIEPVADEILGTAGRDGEQSPDDQAAVRRGLAAARVQLRAEIGSVRMPFQDVLALTSESTLQLEQSSEKGVCVYAEDVPLGTGRPGRSGGRRAVKLTTAASPRGPRPQGAAGPLEHARQGIAGPARSLDDLPILRHIPVRVWAELGRTTVALGQALKLPAGTVIELDEEAQEPVGLFVNGLRFAEGELMVTTEGEWAVRVMAKS